MVDELEAGNLLGSLLDGLSELGICSLLVHACILWPQRAAEARPDDAPSPNFMLTVAAAPLRIPKARTIGGGMRSWGWLILKFSSERSVWAPQYLSLGTWTSPKASLSVRVLAMVEVALNRRRCAVNGVYLMVWRVTVERGRAVRSMEGLAFACASERMQPASAARSCVRALLNMAAIRVVENVVGAMDGVKLAMGEVPIDEVRCLLCSARRDDDGKQNLKLSRAQSFVAEESGLCSIIAEHVHVTVRGAPHRQ